MARWAKATIEEPDGTVTPLPTQSDKGWEVDKVPGAAKDEYPGIPLPPNPVDSGATSDFPSRLVPPAPPDLPNALNKFALGTKIIIQADFRQYVECDCKLIAVIEWSMCFVWTVDQVVVPPGKFKKVLTGPVAIDKAGKTMTAPATFTDPADKAQAADVLKKLGCK